jgi:hypothetical protein
MPWRAAEAMHWQLGDAEMARRAGVTTFSLQPTNPNVLSDIRRQHYPYPRGQSSRGHAHIQSQGGGSASALDSARYGRTPIPSVRDGYSSPRQRIDHSGPSHGHAPNAPPIMPSGRSLAAPHENLSPRHQQQQSHHSLPVPPTVYDTQRQPDVTLPPIQPSSQTRDPGTLPGIAHINFGTSDSKSPVYAAPWLYQNGTVSPNPFGNPPVPWSSAAYGPPSTHPTHSDTTLASYSTSGKRRPSPDVLEGEPTRTRHHGQLPGHDYYEDRPGSGSSGSRHA